MKKEAGEKRHFDVITIGAGVADLYARSSALETRKDIHAPNGSDSCFPMGAKLPLEEISLQTGGGATNASVTFSHLGLKTATICRVGNDLFGNLIKDTLQKERVSTVYVQTDKEHATGQSIIMLADIGHRTIFVHRGASAAINKREIPWSSLSPRWFYVTSLGGDLGLMTMILDRAEATGASVSWNPGNAELKKGFAKLAPLIKRVDVFNVNREEAAMLSDQPVRHLKSIVDALGGLPRMGFLMSDGPKGAYLHTKCCTWYAPPLPGKRVNTTGAGDALGSGFIAGFIKTCDLSIGLKIGMLNALGVITHTGAKAGILTHWPPENIINRVAIRNAHLTN